MFKATAVKSAIACLLVGATAVTLPAKAFDPVTVTGGVAAAKGVIDAVKPYIAPGSRSVLLEVNNNTNGNLWVTSYSHKGGGFGVTPQGRIAPFSSGVFGSRSKGLFTGTEGRAVYTGNGVKLNVYWNNPWAGSNKCNATLSGPRAASYRVFYACGSGTKNAHMRYQLFSR
jgi:hypothetical protein